MPAKTSTIPLYILKIELYKNITLINKNEEMVKPFIKMHGLGNDFVIIDSRNNQFLLNTKKVQLIANSEEESKVLSKKQLEEKLYKTDINFVDVVHTKAIDAITANKVRRI